MTSNHGSIANASTTTARALPSKRSQARMMHKGISRGGDYEAILPTFAPGATIGILGKGSQGLYHRPFIDSKVRLSLSQENKASPTL